MASTPVSSNSPILEVLNRNNYKHWRSRVKTYLLSEDLWDVVVEAITEHPKLEDDDEAEHKAWMKRNAKALYAIQNSCGTDMFSFISDIEKAKTAWEALEQEVKASTTSDSDEKGYDENNVDDFKRYIPFTNFVIRGDWYNAEKCLTELPDALKVRDPRDEHGEIALHVAARLGHVRMVKEMMRQMTKEDLKTKNAVGSTALHETVQNGDVVKELVLLMGEVQDGDGDTALHIAVRNGDVNTVKDLVLLMRQQDLKIKNNDGCTALHLAVKMGNLPIVKELVPKEEGENNKEDAFQRYIPFTNNVICGNLDKAKECLTELAELDYPYYALAAVDPRDGKGNTALHIAVNEQRVHIVKEFVLWLKMRQADLELKTAEDFTSFFSGINLDVSEGLLMERAKSMVEQYEKTLNSILDLQNAEGATALHLAVSKENVHVVKELVPLMRQGGLELKNNNGYTALHQAVLTGNVEIVKELASVMRQGGLELKANNGYTALYQAVLKGNVAVVRELVPLMRQGGLELQNNNGYTALHQAVLTKNVDIVKELAPLMRQKSLEIETANGSNALHLAIKYEHMHIVRELVPLMREEAMEVRNRAGCTALACAMNVGKEAIVTEMVKYMAEKKNNKVFCIGMPPDSWIPVVWAYARSNWKLGRYLYSLTPLDVLNGNYGRKVICCCLYNSKEIDLAFDLLQHHPSLAITETPLDSPMWLLAGMRSEFFSGTRLTRWQKWIYDRIHIQVAPDNIHDISIDIAKSEDVKGDQGELLGSVRSLFRRLVKRLYKLCGIPHITEMKSAHQRIVEFVRCMGEATKNDNLKQEELDMVKRSIFKAIEQGNVEFVTHMCKANPKLLTTFDEQNRSIIHFAIEYRQQDIFSLIHKLDKETISELGLSVVNSDNNMLHFAANFSSLSRFDRIQGASLQMQRELQWFKEVESIVPPEMHKHRNSSNGMTARELFTEKHKNLKAEAEKSMKGTATSCTVVGALIVTVMFAVAFTVPGGNNGSTGLPLLIDKKLFKIFIVSDTISLVSSTTSVITFLGILMSRYAEDDFLKSLPSKMVIGLFTLFLAISTMMIAFCCALVIMLDGELWIVISSTLFACVPVISFVWLLFPLLDEIFMCTYGPGIFDRKV